MRTSARFASLLALLVGALFANAGASGQSTPSAAPPPGSPARRFAETEALYPPWQNGANDDAAHKGFQFTVPTVDSLADFHGSIDDPKLVLFVGGNYYFAMAPLVAEFGREHPELAGRVYYETLPPGILEQQMRAGGIITSGNMTWMVRPDVYLAGLLKVRALIRDRMLTGQPVPYATNDLTIMVPAGNPARISGLPDLGRAGTTLVMPNPRYEGVARQIRASLVKAGGDALANAVYGSKVRDGTTILTHVHHRETPLLLMQGYAQAGVTWTSEAIFQEQIGHPITHVAIPQADNTVAIYAAALAANAPHQAAAEAWLAFIGSEPALRIFEHYGFKRYQRGQGFVAVPRAH